MWYKQSFAISFSPTLYHFWWSPLDTAFSGPFSVKVAVGELTSVNCTVPCTDVITWYTTQYPYTLRQPLSLLTSYKSAASHCTTDLSNTTEMYTEVLVIVATEDINETLLQCASMNVNDQRNAPKYKPWSGVCFSGFAEIIGKYYFQAYDKFSVPGSHFLLGRKGCE